MKYIVLSFVMEDKSEEIKGTLIAYVNAGKDAVFIDNQLQKYPLTEEEKYNLITFLRPYHLAYLYKNQLKYKANAYLITGSVLIYLGLILLQYGILAYGAIILGFTMVYHGNKFFEESKQNIPEMQNKISIFRCRNYRHL